MVAPGWAQVQVVNLRHDEYASFVEFASMVDDGEAEALAICASRHLVLATDDRKARRIALERDVPVRLTSTASMMRHWATRAMEKEPQLSEAVVTALMSPDRGAASCQEEVSAAMNRIMDLAMGDVDPDVRRQITRTLGYVWMSALIGWVNGWSGMERVATEVEIAAHLILDPYGT